MYIYIYTYLYIYNFIILILFAFATFLILPQQNEISRVQHVQTARLTPPSASSATVKTATTSGSHCEAP